LACYRQTRRVCRLGVADNKTADFRPSYREAPAATVHDALIGPPAGRSAPGRRQLLLVASAVLDKADNYEFTSYRRG
jgi:hypothetical protein